MLREFLKSIYYFAYQLFFSRYFILKFFNLNKILLFDKKKWKFFYQYIKNKNDLNTIRQIFIKEEYKFKKNINKLIHSSYLNIIKKNKIPLIIDCGANICASSNYFYINFPEAEIVGIEPDKINFELCMKNNLNNKKIKILNNAISNERFGYSLERKNQDGRASFIKYNQQAEDDKKKFSKTIIMEDIMQNYNMVKYNPFLIKIDIEGHEKKFFESNTDWVKNFKIIIIELHDWMLPNKNISLTFFRAIKKNLIDYEIYNFGENTVVINKLEL